MATSRCEGRSPTTERPPTLIAPLLGVSRPAKSRNKVLFPQPEGPTKTRNSPSATVRSRSRKTVTGAAPRRGG